MPPSPLTLTVRRGGIGILESLSSEWDALCDEGPCASITWRPAWVLSYSKAYLPATPLHIIEVRRDGKLRGLLPLAETRIGIGPFAIRRFRPTANFMSWEFGIIHGMDDADTVTEEIYRYLNEWNGWDVLACEVARDGGPFAELIRRLVASGAHPTPRDDLVGYVLHSPPAHSSLEETIELCLNERTRETKRKLRQVQALGDIAWQRLGPGSPKADMYHAFEDFQQLEVAGWKGSTGDPVQVNPRVQNFYRNLIDRDLLIIHRLELDGTLLASEFGCAHETRGLAMRIAYNENFRRYSPGQLMMVYALKDFADLGCPMVDTGGTHAGTPTAKTGWRHETYAAGRYMVTRKGRKGSLIAFAWSTALPTLSRAYFSPRIRRIVRRRGA